MIHQLLNLTRSLFCVDCETTGVDTEKDRIVEIGFEQWTAEGLVKEWRSLINPGIPIPKSASDVHGILGHDLQEAPTFLSLAANLAKGFSNCDWAGKHVRFDLQIIAAEMARAKVPWSYQGARIIDAERLEQLAVPRSLSHLYEKYTGKKLEGAHGALEDVRASTAVIARQLLTHDVLPRDLDALHKAQWPDEWLDGRGSFKKIGGVATCTFGKNKGKPMSAIEVSYWDWILKSDFPNDIKQLASEAKLGRFP